MQVLLKENPTSLMAKKLWLKNLNLKASDLGLNVQGNQHLRIFINESLTMDKQLFPKVLERKKELK